MNMALDFIFRRRSIRKYTNQPVTDEQINAILHAAMAAPSAHNLKPWHFSVIRERATLDFIAQKHPYGKMLFAAPLAIIVCGDTQRSRKRWDQDCAAATENILLSLPALGLGGVWVGYHPLEGSFDFLRDYLQLPENIKVFSIVSIGHPAETKEARTQYDSSVIHYERW